MKPPNARRPRGQSRPRMNTRNGNRQTNPRADAIGIDPEFRALIVPLPAGDLAELERKLLAEGCRGSLKVWAGHGILLDGYECWEICRRHHLPFATEACVLPDREAARALVIAQQLGRNPTPLAISYLRGKRYQAVKRQGHRSDLAARRDGSPPADGRGPAARRAGTSNHKGYKSSSTTNHNGYKSSSQRLAAEYGAGEETIRRDGRFAGWVDRLAANCGEEARRLTVSREVKLTRKDVEWWAGRPARQQRALLRRLRRDGRLTRPKKQTKGLMLVPKQPKALARTVADRLGRADAVRTYRELGRILGLTGAKRKRSAR